MSLDNEPQLDLDVARSFLTCLFPGETSFGFQTIPPKKGPHAGDKHLLGFASGTLEDSIKTLHEKIVRTAGVYFTLNRLTPNPPNRQDPSFIGTMGVVSLDLDDGTRDALIESGFLIPHACVETSPGRFHFHWRVNGLVLRSETACTAGEIIERLARVFGGDTSISDIPRVMRLPGSLNRNHGDGGPTRVKWRPMWSEGSYELDEFLEALGKVEEAVGLPPWVKGAAERPAASGERSAPVRQWAEPELLIEALELLRNDGWAEDDKLWELIGFSFARLSGGDEAVEAAFEDWSHQTDNNRVPNIFGDARLGKLRLSPGPSAGNVRKWLQQHHVDGEGYRAHELGEVIVDIVDEALAEARREGVIRDFADDEEDAGGEQKKAVREGARPLRRPTPAGEEFPVEALGKVLGDAVIGASDIVQSPIAMAANSFLSVASLAVQGHVNIEHPITKRSVPTSTHHSTIAGSGLRKTETDRLAMLPVQIREDELARKYEQDLAEYQVLKDAYDTARAAAKKRGTTRRAKEEAIRALGPAPVAPIHPTLTTDDATIEGLIMEYGRSSPSLGIFNNEAGTIVAGHGMTPENKVKTLAGISRLWDGQTIKRSRADREKAVHLQGCRLSMHIMLQPDVSRAIFSDPVALDQGFTGRILTCAPPSNEGTRFQRPEQPGSRPAIERYKDVMLPIFRTPLPTTIDARKTPDHYTLSLTAEARQFWLDLTDEIEGEIGPSGKYRPVKSFANKLPENILRVAAILHTVENWGEDADDDARFPLVGIEVLERATRVGKFYLSEALRIFDSGYVPPEIGRAEELLRWLHATGRELVGLTEIYHAGPNSIRTKEPAKQAVDILVDHGWLIPLPGKGHVIGDKKVRDAWRVVKAD